MTMYFRGFRRAELALAGVATIALGFVAAASAHVTIVPTVNTSGEFSKITVRVPNESDTAATTQVRLNLPSDAPFASVSVQPHPGWTAELTTEQFSEPVEVGDLTLDEAVTSVTWTADQGFQIGPGEFDEFAVSVGPLPEPGAYLFPTVQTYSDGEVVAWDMEPSEGGDEPERPAPALTVVAASNATDEDGSSHTGASGDANPVDDSSDGLARGIAIGGVVLGAAGLGIGGAGYLRSRRA